MLEWFTTIPGILIICGVILLIIAIVLFIAGAKKSKKEGTINTESMIEKPLENVSNMETVIDPTPVAPVTVETVNPSVDITTVSTEAPITLEEPIQISEPERVEFNTPETVIEQPSIDIPVMDMPTVTEFPTVKENNSTIYGGEVPNTSFSINEEKPVTIYGGNDPLEATQVLPKVEEHHEPYGGTYPEARIVEPVQSIEIPTPVEEVVSAMPKVEPVFDIMTPEEPEVVMPSVEPVVETIPTSEVISNEVEPAAVNIPAQEETKPVVEEL